MRLVRNTSNRGGKEEGEGGFRGFKSGKKDEHKGRFDVALGRMIK